MLPAGKLVKPVGDVARAEQQFPVAFLEIVDKAPGRSKATPESRQGWGTPAQAIAAGALDRSHRKGAGVGHKKTPALLPGSA